VRREAARAALLGKEFPSLKPVKRRGNRRYYQRHDVLMIRQIRSLLYEQGFTIGGARQRLDGEATRAAAAAAAPPVPESKVPAELVRQMRIDLEAVLEILR
jgi:DNA-binding transcriptional MerR regulator